MKIFAYPTLFIIGFIVVLAVFGLSLGLAWAIGGGQTYKLLSTLVAVGAAFVVGGFVLIQLTKQKTALLSVIFGIVWGSIGAIYLFGPKWEVLAAIPIIGMLSGLGGRLANYLSGN